jgi:hypothetical protein
MKPLGSVLAILDSPETRVALDDDYAWHVRQRQAGLRTPHPATLNGRAPWVPRLVASLRANLVRRGAHTARRA